MSKNEHLSTPREIDEKLAALHAQAAIAERDLVSHEQTLLHAAGAEFYYRGRRRVTDMMVEDAAKKLGAARDEYCLTYSRKNGALLDRHEAAVTALEAIEDEIAEVADLYTGWSRFFVVTSSAGHIHSSRACSTCRPTTTFGWLPNLSGKTEAEAIEFFGSAAETLCSVCFPDAPSAGQERNLTTKERDAILAGKTPETKAAANTCPGSGQYASREQPHRLGYYTGNWATCPHCGEHVTTTTRDSLKLRKHAPKAA